MINPELREIAEQAQNNIFGKECEQDTRITQLYALVKELQVTMVNHVQMKHRQWMAKPPPWWKFWDRTPTWVFGYTSPMVCDKEVD